MLSLLILFLRIPAILPVNVLIVPISCGLRWVMIVIGLIGFKFELPLMGMKAVCGYDSIVLKSKAMVFIPAASVKHFLKFDS